MAKAGETFGYLSLTGRLSLQEKKDRKDRKGRITFKKKISFWFWFDEKECLLKYYKNSSSYLSHLHNYEGTIDLRNAKVSPSEVYLDGKGTFSVDREAVSGKTFLIFTSIGNVFALTTENDIECHKWIKKLQEKRAEWEKKEQVKTKAPQKEDLFFSTQEGLVSKAESRSSSSRSHVHKIFEDYLGRDGVPSYGTSCPQSSPVPVRSAAILNPPTTTSRSLEEESFTFINAEEVTDGPERNEMKQSTDSCTIITLDTQQQCDELSQAEAVPLTEQEKEILRLKVELSEAHQEKEKLLQKVAFFEDEEKKHHQLKMQLLNEIQELMETVHKFKTKSGSSAQDMMQQENENLKDVIKKLQRSLRSIDGEIELCKAQLKERDKRLREGYKKQRELEDNLLHVKAKYVSLLDYSFKIPTPSPTGMSVDDSDPMEEKLKQDLLNLIQEESSSDASLVDVSGDLSVFEDQYGELHDWNNDGNICHFLCRQLYLHYTEYEQDSLTQEWYNYVKQLKANKDGHWEIPSESSRSKRRELRGYLRKGIPQPMRSAMWASLAFSYVGKMRDVKNSTAVGGNYYNSLLRTTSLFQKQILLDKYRTMPSNKHFKMDRLGAKKLERVLVAYSNHNRNVGYCQGMNMIAAVGLLFLDEETTFWYLVTIIEKLMPQHYFTNGLAAAQADQVVMKELVSEKLPNLSDHLESNGIDVTVVTFNWFLTLFVDALPTESMLRVMDCFLLEDRKIIFRLSLAIFKLHECRILAMNDPVSIFQFVKEVARHIFNVEELFRVAFKELEPFPSRSAIQSRRQPHLESFLADWKERELLKNQNHSIPSSAAVSSIPVIPPQKHRRQFQWECGTAVNSEEVWLCCGERQVGKICIIQAGKDVFDITSPGIDVGSKILCIKAFPNNGITMIGTLDFSIHAICISSRKELWSLKMNDSVLDFAWFHENLICALADGYIASVSPAGRDLPSTDPVLYRIGSTAVQCMTLTTFDHVWVGCGKAITVLEAQSHEPVKAIVIPDKAGKVYKMELSDQGIWITFKTSTLLYLYDCEHMVEILTVDYLTLIPETVEATASIDSRITVMTTFDNVVWIGTGNATFYLFKLSSSVAKPGEQIQRIVRSSKRVSDSMKDSWRHRTREGDDEGLVSGRKQSLTLPSHSQMKFKEMRESDESRVNDDGGEQGLGRQQFGRRSFGRTFRKHNRKESHDLKGEAVYRMEHLWSCEAPYLGKECLKVTTVKPIKKNGRRYIISCVNSSSMFPKAVQLWESNGESSLSSWNYTSLPECYEEMSKESSLKVVKHKSTGRGRTYSTILGSLSPTQNLPSISDLSFSLVEEESV